MLGLWQGTYRNFSSLWLRWYDRTGWIPTLAERSETERQSADRLAASPNAVATKSLHLI